MQASDHSPAAQAWWKLVRSAKGEKTPDDEKDADKDAGKNKPD